jgi:hypothetical protein
VGDAEPPRECFCGHNPILYSRPLCFPSTPSCWQFRDSLKAQVSVRFCITATTD